MTEENNQKEESVEIKENNIEEQKETEDYINTLRRLQAEFENYIKRTEKEKQELTKYATHKVIIKLLKIIDDYEKALETIKPKLDQEITRGLEMIHKQLHRVLEEEGVSQIKTEKTKFDPYKHEVIDTTEGKEDNLIVDEIQRGYMIHDKVLRTSKVRISKKRDE